MDNVCHTLVGAALAEAGLKRRTALGTATLIIVTASTSDAGGRMVCSRSSCCRSSLRR
jgi:hypothetical protein